MILKSMRIDLNNLNGMIGLMENSKNIANTLLPN